MSAPAEAARRDLVRPPDVAARHDGGKALLLTVLGEFVLPAGGSVWTSTLVAAADVLGIAEKNARQAIARIGDRGLIEPTRHGRRVRWSLTGEGARLLADGARRIYSFGASSIGWDGEWLVVYCPVADTGRSGRNRLRNHLRFLGFGELAPRLLISPHLDREAEVRQLLAGMGVADESVVMHSTSGPDGDDGAWVARAWDLDQLATVYDEFAMAHRAVRPADAAASFRAVVELVHDWRRFPFVDPELPAELLPDGWTGDIAASVFSESHAAWSPAAHRWMREQEGAGDAA